MTTSKNMLLDAPTNLRTANYGEHYCHLYNRQHEFVGSLYLTAKMRKVWRTNKFSVVIVDV